MNQRDFTFRAWDKEKKEWCYGYEILGGFNLKGEVILMGEFGRYPLEYLLENIIVMQSTGLKDKNAKDIFEGDIILSGSTGHRLVVGFNKESAAFGACKNDSFQIEDMYWFYNDIIIEQDQWEIIGNKFENPELLTQ